MIRGVGIDSVEVERMKKIVEKGDKFAKRVLTPKEFEQYQQHICLIQFPLPLKKIL